MTTHLSLFSRLAVTATVVASLMPLPAGAQSENPGSMLLMRPHCENPSDTTGSAPTFSEFMRSGVGDCKNYSARDPQTQQTSAMNIGDVLDMDIVVFNPHTFTASGNVVAVQLRLEGALRKNGQPFINDAIHMWQLNEAGKVISYRHYNDTAMELAAWRA